MSILKIINLIDSHLNNAKNGMKNNPNKYIYTYDALKQIREAILLEDYKERKLKIEKIINKLV